MLVERLAPRWSSTGLIPFLGRPGQCGYFYATPTGVRLATMYGSTCNRPIHGGSSVESGFEPGTLQPQSRNLTTRPPQPQIRKGVPAQAFSSSSDRSKLQGQPQNSFLVASKRNADKTVLK
ncbi:hypothetical protein AVEN_165632-1 [Araneus ventricosus]|uniref:Uncharacterized protein n=1 Tax=Araneus ventricosus TaxID=182803 RepID=A0A4Y2IKW7_ARAVE|nr:hypothetical protein AVEN_165632-1 [Araneus ventricosus]